MKPLTVKKAEHLSELLKHLEKWLCIELAAITFLAACLFVLLKRRDLLLRYTSAEARFFLRLGMSARLVSASRRLSEGRFVVYFVATLLILGVVVFVAGAVTDVHFRLSR